MERQLTHMQFGGRVAINDISSTSGKICIWTGYYKIKKLLLIFLVVIIVLWLYRRISSFLFQKCMLVYLEVKYLDIYLRFNFTWLGWWKGRKPELK